MHLARHTYSGYAARLDGAARKQLPAGAGECSPPVSRVLFGPTRSRHRYLDGRARICHKLGVQVDDLQLQVRGPQVDTEEEGCAHLTGGCAGAGSLAPCVRTAPRFVCATKVRIVYFS